MEKIIFNGETYVYRNGKFYDSSFIELTREQATAVATHYFGKVNYKELSCEKLLEHVKTLKQAEMFDMVVEVGLWGLATKLDANFIRSILPIITSAYRGARNSQRAIDLAKEYLKIDAYQSAALFTSLAAACCDVGDYAAAQKYANYAYARWGISTELSLVMNRIQAEIR